MSAEETAALPVQVKDAAGEHVYPGHRIAYAVNRGRSARLQIGDVVGFAWSAPRWDGDTVRTLKMRVEVLDRDRKPRVVSIDPAFGHFVRIKP